MSINWDQIVENHYREIYSFVYHMCGKREEAEDVTQDTFYKVFKAYQAGKLPELSDKELKYFIYRSARNTYYDKFRFLKRLGKFLKTIDRDEKASEDKSFTLMIKELIENLPKRQKEVFILRHWHGFSTSETASLLNINEGSVKSHLSRAVDRLKTELTTEAASQTLRKVYE